MQAQVLRSSNYEIIGGSGTGDFSPPIRRRQQCSRGRSRSAMVPVVPEHTASAATSLLNAAQQSIGLAGSGTFNQSGGTNSVSGSLDLGEEAGSNRTCKSERQQPAYRSEREHRRVRQRHIQSVGRNQFGVGRTSTSDRRSVAVESIFSAAADGLPRLPKPLATTYSVPSSNPVEPIPCRACWASDTARERTA